MEKEIITFIEQNFLMGECLEIENDASLFDKGVIDSVGVLDLAIFLEERYKIKVEDQDYIPENFDSINGILDYLKRKGMK